NVMILMFLPLIFIAISCIRRKDKLLIRNIAGVALGSSLALMFTLAELQMTRTIANESGEYAAFPFSISNAKALLPTFLKSFFSPQWYLLTGALALVGLATCLRQPRLTVVPSILVLGYVFLYTTHVRNYYLLHGALTNSTVAFRLS